MKKLVPAMLAFVLLLALAGCQESNPLLGTWKAETSLNGKPLPGASMLPEIVITFTKDKMAARAGGVENSGPCTYEKRSDKVWAVTAEGKVLVLEVVDKDTLRGDVGMGAALILKRQ